MTPQEFVEWLKQNNLFNSVEKHYPVFEKVLSQCLGVRKEFLLIVGDVGYEGIRVAPIMTGCYLLAAKRLGLKYSLVMQEPKKVHSSADDVLVKALSEFNEYNAMAIAISGKMGGLKAFGKSFRKYARSHAQKFASTMSLQELSTNQFNYLLSAIDVDYGHMQKVGQQVKEKLDNGTTARVTTAAGTDITFDIKRKYAISNVADYDEPRQGGNIPAGEVYIAPNGKGVNGRVVIDGSVKIREQTLMVKHPVTLTVEHGSVIKIDGKEEAALLESSLSWAEKKAQYPWGIRRVGELGIGINPNARIVGPTLINEKTLGSAHIAIGSNEWFGGSVYSITHFDQVFKNATVYVDEARIRL